MLRIVVNPPPLIASECCIKTTDTRAIYDRRSSSSSYEQNGFLMLRENTKSRSPATKRRPLSSSPLGQSSAIPCYIFTYFVFSVRVRVRVCVLVYLYVWQLVLPHFSVFHFVAVKVEGELFWVLNPGPLFIHVISTIFNSLHGFLNFSHTH